MARGRHPTRIHIDPPSEQVAAKYLRYWPGRDLHRETHAFPVLTSQELFGNDRPLEIDFGCGVGTLAYGRARQYPYINILGIDLSQKPLFCAITEAVKCSLENIRFIRGNFNVMLPLLLPQTLSAAYYLFPNPPRDYLRARANERRRRFLQSVYNALVPGGRFFFATDASEFFRCMHDIANIELLYETRAIEESDLATRYWRMWEDHGRKVGSFVVEKK